MRHPKIILGLPGPAPQSWRAAFTAFLASAGKHLVSMRNSGGSWDNFNKLWVDALNAAARGEATHFAMLHADIVAKPGWLDTLFDILDGRGLDLLSVAVPLKDDSGICSCGVVNPDYFWSPLKRFTLHELHRLPETFTAEDAGYPGFALAHNNGMWIADLRSPCWREKNPDGSLRACFDFRRAIVADEHGVLHVIGESEDWRFSRMIGLSGAKTAITRAVTVAHCGGRDFCSDEPYGAEHDEETRRFWDQEYVACLTAGTAG
jgi:hypothetical protein